MTADLHTLVEPDVLDGSEVRSQSTSALLRAVVIGAVGSTEVLLRELGRAPGWQVPLVITLPLDLHSRHSDFVDLAPHAEEVSARLLAVSRTNDVAALEAVRAAEPDYVFVVGWSQLVTPEFLAVARHGSIGYHPAPLPRLRGRAPIPWTILLNEPISASSLFWIGNGVDDGDILGQRYFHVAPDETAQSLYDKHMMALGCMAQELLPLLASGEQPRLPQDERYATWGARRTPADGLIDWNRDADWIDRLIRAVGRPYPGAFTYADSCRITVWKARPIVEAERHHGMPGQILAKRGSGVVVQTGNGLIELLEWEAAEGRSPAVHSIFKDR